MAIVVNKHREKANFLCNHRLVIGIKKILKTIIPKIANIINNS